MHHKYGLTLFVCACLLAGCAASQTQPPAPTATLPVVPSTVVPSPVPATAAPLASPQPAASPTTPPSLTPPPAPAADICTDPQVTALLENFKTALLGRDGLLFGSLVSSNGMEVRYFRNGNVITYTPEQARFLFETTYAANWGPDLASGIEKTGAFQDVIVPRLQQVFSHSHTLHCNELPHGGATYEVAWPYATDFYAIYFAGTEQYSNMDWNTWGVGLAYINGQPYIQALVQYFWEP